MTRLLHPPERGLHRRSNEFDPVVEGVRHHLSRELSLAIWERVCADATDSFSRRDEEQAERRFHEVAARIAARGGRLRPDVGRLTRVGVELDGVSSAASSVKELAVRIPGRETLAAKEARRWAEIDYAHEAVRGETAGRLPPRRTDGGMTRREFRFAQQLECEYEDKDALKALPKRPIAPGKRTLTEQLDTSAPLRTTPVPRPREPTTGVAQMKRAGDAQRWLDVAFRSHLHESEQELPDDGPGQPMPVVVRSKMERAFGVDFSGVRIFEGARAEALGARAYTQGTEIHFAPGEYRPESARGQEILGHELAHVVQQSQGYVGQTTEMRGVAVNADAGMETAADEMGAKAARGEPARNTGPATQLEPGLRLPATAASVVQRMPYDEVRVGKWFRVQIAKQVVHLYLRTKRVGMEMSPPRFEFFRDERDRGQPIIISDETQIEAQVEAPRRDSESSEHDEQDDSLESGPARTDPGRLGVISWNVNHLSEHDFIGSMKALIGKLKTFPSETLTGVFKTVRAVLDELRQLDYVKEYLKDPQNFKENFERNREFVKRLKRLQDKADKVIALCTQIRAIEKVIESFDAQEFLDHLEDMASTDWIGLYEKANQDTSARAELARRVAQLRGFADHVESAKRAMATIRELQNHKMVLERLGGKDSALELSKHAAEVERALPSPGDTRKLPSALHADNIVMHVGEMFDKNEDWLDIVTLHEVNDTAPLDKAKGSYDIYHGPEMESSGETGQREFYPLLVRKDAGIELVKVYVVHTNGTMEETEHDKPYNWNKHKSKQKDKVYRPMVIYELRKGGKKGQIYWVAVVHTTPESDSGISEFNRNKIFGEVEAGLATLRQGADKRGIPLIVGGDYYLTAEAVVKELTRKDKKLVEDDEEDGSDEKDEDKNDYRRTVQKLAQLEQHLKKQRDALLSSKPKQGHDDEQTPSTNSWELDALNERLKFVTEAQKDEQILRNLCELTVAAQVEKLGLFLAQPTSGTNPKANPLSRWFDLQIADFFIHNANLPDVNIGLVRPEGGLTTVDSEELHDSRYWQHFSDHFPVGGVFSVHERRTDERPDAFRGEGSDKAVELARVSNRNRFARLQLMDDRKEPDLSKLKDDKIELLAIQYLHARIADFYGEKSPTPPTMDECIEVIREAERAFSDGEPLFITEPGDFEPNPDHDVKPLSEKGPSNRGRRGGSRGGLDNQRNEPFLLDRKQQLQQGWNCGDIALRMTRGELVQWLLANAGDPAVRALMGPEIWTAAATSLMRGDFPEKKTGGTEKGSSNSSDKPTGPDENELETSTREKEESLRQLFKLFDDAEEEAVRVEAASQIHSMLAEKKPSSINQQGLPPAMQTEELRDLLQGYFDANEAMRDLVIIINDALELQGGHMLDGTQLGRYFNQHPEQVQCLEAKTYAEFQRLLLEFQTADQRLQQYVTRPEVFRAYVQQYYGNQGWMVYHLDFGGGDHASTSVIDLAAKFRLTQVRVWVYRSGQFQLNRETEQYGHGVINILYNGYNHFIGLTENPDYVPPDQLTNRDL